jgi:hypothetical protein
VKITVDCLLDPQLLALPSESYLAILLAKAQITPLELPLEALVAVQHGLQAAADYPLAAIAAAVDGLDVATAYWLRADPVNLVLQRDCFSLAEPVPLAVAAEHANLIVASLNQHFAQESAGEDLVFMIGKSGAWYLRAQLKQNMSTTLPSVAMHKNVHQFLPQGEAASQWVTRLNEIQMLLHEHPANLARESAREPLINSLWLSGGGSLPEYRQDSIDAAAADLLLANSVLYQGLAQWAGRPSQSVPETLQAVLQHKEAHIHLQLPAATNLDEIWFKPILQALKNKKITRLTLNLGVYDKSLVVQIAPLDLYKFWRKTSPVVNYLHD